MTNKAKNNTKKNSDILIYFAIALVTVVLMSLSPLLNKGIYAKSATLPSSIKGQAIDEESERILEAYNKVYRDAKNEIPTYLDANKQYLKNKGITEANITPKFDKYNGPVMKKFYESLIKEAATYDPEGDEYLGKYANNGKASDKFDLGILISESIGTYCGYPGQPAGGGLDSSFEFVKQLSGGSISKVEGTTNSYTNGGITTEQVSERSKKIFNDDFKEKLRSALDDKTTNEITLEYTSPEESKDATAELAKKSGLETNGIKSLVGGETIFKENVTRADVEKAIEKRRNEERELLSNYPLSASYFAGEAFTGAENQTKATRNIGEQFGFSGNVRIEVLAEKETGKLSEETENSNIKPSFVYAVSVYGRREWGEDQFTPAFEQKIFDESTREGQPFAGPMQAAFWSSGEIRGAGATDGVRNPQNLVIPSKNYEKYWNGLKEYVQSHKELPQGEDYKILVNGKEYHSKENGGKRIVKRSTGPSIKAAGPEQIEFKDPEVEYYPSLKAARGSMENANALKFDSKTQKYILGPYKLDYLSQETEEGKIAGLGQVRLFGKYENGDKTKYDDVVGSPKNRKSDRFDTVVAPKGAKLDNMDELGEIKSWSFVTSKGELKKQEDGKESIVPQPNEEFYITVDYDPNLKTIEKARFEFVYMVHAAKYKWYAGSYQRATNFRVDEADKEVLVGGEFEKLKFDRTKSGRYPIGSEHYEPTDEERANDPSLRDTYTKTVTKTRDNYVTKRRTVEKTRPNG